MQGSMQGNMDLYSRVSTPIRWIGFVQNWSRASPDSSHTALTVLKLGRLFPLGSQVGVRGSRVCQFILVILCIYFIFIYSHWGVRGAGKQGFAIFDDGRGLTW